MKRMHASQEHRFRERDDMSAVDRVLGLYRLAAKTGGEVLVTPHQRYLTTDYTLGDTVISLRMSEFRRYYESKLGLFNKFYKDRVESNGKWDGVTTSIGELSQYRSFSDEAIVAAFQKDILEAKTGQ